jgi:hypothetical protein
MTAQILYAADGTPIGPRAIVNIYRPPTTTVTIGGTNFSQASVVPFGGEGAATLLYAAIISDLSLSMNGKVYGRTGTFMEDLNDPVIVRGTVKLSLTAEIASANTPLLCAGDFLNLNIGNQAGSSDGNPLAIPTTRWVADANSLATSGINKYSLSLNLDRVNSSPNLKEF